MNDALDSAPTPEEVDETSEALAALFASPLFAGPDPSIVSDVKSSEEIETAQWVEESEVHAQVAAIYAAIVARAPEHKIQPSLDQVRRT